MDKHTAKVIGIVSGAIFVASGLLLAFAIDTFSALVVDLGGVAKGTGFAELVFAAAGSIVGAVIIVTSLTLVVSHSRLFRVIGGITIILVAGYGSFYTFGGLFFGIIFALVAGLIAIFHKEPVNASSDAGFVQG